MADCECTLQPGEPHADDCPNRPISRRERVMWAAERDTLRAENEQLREMLTRVTDDDVQWACGDGGGDCPWCSGSMFVGHDADCPYIAARALLAQGQK